MNSKVKNLLYRNPQLYELVYPEPNDETPMMCRRMFSRFLAKPPRSILDIGCGTARDLDSLSRDGAESWGVDCLSETIGYAKLRRPHLHLQIGDMLTVRLKRKFDVIMSMGSALMYALSDSEVEAAFKTFAAHSRKGTLLIIDINNAASYLGGENFKPTTKFKVRTSDFSAETRIAYSFNRRKQFLVRKRLWKIKGQKDIKDFCEYRMFFPAGLENLLNKHGFEVRGMFDNKKLRKTDLSGPRLYVASVFK
jgi:SAM-dependent methyltransferase